MAKILRETKRWKLGSCLLEPQNPTPTKPNQPNNKQLKKPKFVEQNWDQRADREKSDLSTKKSNPVEIK